MSTSAMSPDLAELRERYEQLERLCEKAVEAERAAYLH